MTSEVNQVKNQFSSNPHLWPQFLESIKISGLHGFNGEEIYFRFPICAIVGENGMGKSTILKSLACAYQSSDVTNIPTYYPSTFFPETKWDTFPNVELEYKIRNGTNSVNFKAKKSQRWRFSGTKRTRNVIILDVSRVLPLDSTRGYTRLINTALTEISSSQISDEYRSHLSYILNRNYTNARFSKTNQDDTREVGILARQYGEVSQFHQGAGEDATLDLIKVLDTIPNNSLVLIDEVEASLHPKAQRRLIELLIKLTRTKRLQIIVTTHSPYILAEIPAEGRLLVLDSQNRKEIIPGISVNFALSQMDENDHPDLYIFTEDMEAATIVYEIIKKHDNSSTILRRVLAKPVGPSNVVEILGTLKVEGRLPYMSLSVLDADKPTSNGCIKLPGNLAPERQIYKDLKSNNWNELENRFNVGPGILYSILDEAILLPNHHDWNEFVGNKLKKSKSHVWEILVNQWVNTCLTQNEIDNFNELICNELIPASA
ncbi:ATP-dependent endonuclease [Leptospira biflexa serovar Patoc strain 'Patoc 1 (Ames)']|uniref:Putative ATPase n=1 Tax=Leptospira biflexa serovar Patoc (strain Patoc 1 / ATCC 23582 / Paris) TaxID=456481 RepID=B0ST34_LEPBP|nr:ATP-binding protein [Leptospira biflexa]ABZ94611.1 ATP-dependent endonuclease [Leptospira biflexa serovar Patoc strain 'Patoc 1 (Ames)']ABZ98274.1 Putative ATPase [Leptospira biflexa serovar Patoc strain 'Patoc 1 (Paris)']